MSNKDKRHRKRWLISRLKTSGSKRTYTGSEDYSDTRNSKQTRNLEDLPMHESFGKSMSFYNGKINYGLLVRFLRGKVGLDWEEVHKEIMERIPKDLMPYKDILFSFVADKVEIQEAGIWDKRKQRYLWLERPDERAKNRENVWREFYVNPETNRLERVENFPSLRKTKDMDREALRVFREEEQQERLKRKRCKANQKAQSETSMRKILDERKDEN